MQKTAGNISDKSLRQDQNGFKNLLPEYLPGIFTGIYTENKREKKQEKC
jgi:hypothetical protein